MDTEGGSASTTPWRLLAGIVLFWTAGAALLPIVQDEAYYVLWAERPDLGYFDHPPLVALMALTSRLLPGSWLVARLGTLVVAGLTLAVSLRLFRVVGLTDKRALACAVLLANFNLMGLVFGFITVPDTVLMLAWVAALHEAAMALRGDERRWVTAGMATGVGLLAKYTMLLMGPVFLWALVVATRRGPTRGLRSPWPYLGGVAALLVFLPHLYWNAGNDWITVRFQLRHGFAMDRPALERSAELPEAQEAKVGSPEHELARVFVELEKKAKRAEKEPRPYDDLLGALNNYVGYYASQVALWGAAAVVVLLAARRRWRLRRAGGAAPATSLLPATRTLLVAATAVPLIVFGLISLGSKVEANWSAMYVFGAAALLAPLVAGEWRRLRIAAAINLGIAATLLVHAQWGLLPVRPHKDRVLAETHGFAALAREVAALEGQVFADSYQLVAMTRFYAPGLRIHQWPGITRDSELVRNPPEPRPTGAALTRDGSFWLVTTELPPPVLSPFQAVEMAQLRDCKAEGLQVLTSQAAMDSPESRCKTPIHAWYLVRYGAPP